MILHNTSAASLLAAGRVDEANTLTEAALAASPGEINLLMLLAVIRLRQQRRADAESIFADILERAPQWSVGHYNYAFYLRMLGNVQGALEHFRAAAELQPDWALAHYEFALTAVRVGSQVLVPQAQEHLRIAARLMPDWPEAHYELGRVLLYTSAETEAEAALRRALELRPAYPEAMHQLASSLMEQDRVEEALPLLEAVVAAMPDNRDAQRDLSRIRASRQPAKRERLARYPRSQREFADLPKLIETYILPEFSDVRPIISKETPVFTLGSCFAANIARYLQRCGVPAEHVIMAEELNSTYANRHFVDWLQYGPHTPQTERIEAVLGADYGTRVRALAANARVIVYSLGVAPCFFDRENGEFVLTLGENLHAALLAKQFLFRTTSVTENVDNLEAMIAALRIINPNAHIMLTVSPVPLKATFERKSAIVADCVSKSTLRVVAHEVMAKNHPRVHYWPSFEIVRWIGGHSQPVFGADDDSPFHPNDAIVRLIIETFLRVYATSDVMESNVVETARWDRLELAPT